MFIAALLVAGSLQAQKQFNIQGDVSKVSEPIYKIYLSYYANGKSTTDSSFITDGKYSFKGSVTDPVMVTLRASYVADTASNVRKMISFKIGRAHV